MGCIGECPSDGACPANSECSGYAAAGSATSWAETLVAGTTVVKASHVTEIQNALTAERTHATRRGVSSACATNCSDAPTLTSKSIGDVVGIAEYNQLINEINATEYNVNGATEAPGTIVSLTLVAGTTVIKKTDIDAIRSAINQIETNCICNAYCSCDINCGCDGECPSDGTPY